MDDRKWNPSSQKHETSKTNGAIETLDKTISNLEMELAAARATQESIMEGSPVSESRGKRKYLVVVGINTAFSSSVSSCIKICLKIRLPYNQGTLIFILRRIPLLL
ncbi:putative beta-1,3-galactosyltransferase 3 [Silene latifolia]|uniref:putative beta-1,3-galactosyltransferase 3 n=1 Tax=Silene latifolia TaxID=37657 RepID=UPI003D785F55